ncbi:MAG TPA: acyltransferase [Acidimicrobiales bacterium]|nr:acyltransferase [Acidimicrobiales bacterium]
MFPSTALSPRRRAFAAGLIHRAWAWISVVGSLSPDDAAALRFRALGTGSCLAFPPGPLINEGWVAIGEATLIGPQVSLAAGLPGEALDPSSPPIISIGDRCNIGRGSSINGRVGVVIEDDVTTGPNVYVTDHNHRYDDLDLPIGRQWVNEAPVRIGAGSWLATGVVVLPGADIGRGVTVAANSVVRGEFPDHCVIAGAPAKVVRRHVEGVGWDPPLPGFSTAPPEGWPTT